jgi:hypothetical protein
MAFLSRFPAKSRPYWLKALAAVVGYALTLYLLVLAIAYWFLGPTFMGSVALTGGIICGAGALIGAVLASQKDKSY